MRGLAEREGLLSECGEVGELTEKEWDVDFKGRPYNGNLVCGTLLRGGGSPACGSVGDGLQFRRAQGVVHMLYGKVEERGLGDKQLGALCLRSGKDPETSLYQILNPFLLILIDSNLSGCDLMINFFLIKL